MMILLRLFVKTSDNDYRRIVRGGGYTYSSDYAKVSDRRVYNTPEMRWGNCGVRIVRNVNQQKKKAAP